MLHLMLRATLYRGFVDALFCPFLLLLLLSTTMAILSKPMLRDKLSSAFNDLFVDDKDILLHLRDFLASKSSKNSARNASGRKAGGDDNERNNASLDAPPAVVPGRVLEPPSVVIGQSILGLFGEQVDEATLLEECRFTNGDELNLEHRLHSLVECPGDKAMSEKVFAADGYSPSDSLLVAAMNCFSCKKKRYFFRDGLYLCVIFAKELGMNLSMFLRVRGWLDQYFLSADQRLS